MRSFDGSPKRFIENVNLMKIHDLTSDSVQKERGRKLKRTTGSGDLIYVRE